MIARLLVLGFIITFGNFAVWSISYSIGYGRSYPNEVFLSVTLIGFYIIIAARFLESSLTTKLLLLSISAVFAASYASLMINDAFSFGRLDFYTFQSLMFLSFVLAGLIPISKPNPWSGNIFTGFVLSFYLEMYGFPLTVFMLNLLLKTAMPLTLESGHLLAPFIGMEMSHILSASLVFLGASLLTIGWYEIYKAKGSFVDWGIYKYVKHPQYIGILVMTGGLLVEYPTIVAGAMWLAMAFMYYRLARFEAKEIKLKKQRKMVNR